MIDKIKMVICDDGIMPVRAYKNDAGLDLFSPETVIIPPFGMAIIDTKISVAIPDGYVGLITSKSGLMAKGITSRGTIDSSYRGTIKAVLYNQLAKSYIVERGDKVTQLVLLPIITPEIEIVSELDETDRGVGGFGSTGK